MIKTCFLKKNIYDCRSRPRDCYCIYFKCIFCFVFKKNAIYYLKSINSGEDNFLKNSKTMFFLNRMLFFLTGNLNNLNLSQRFHEHSFEQKILINRRVIGLWKKNHQGQITPFQLFVLKWNCTCRSNWTMRVFFVLNVISHISWILR